MIEQAGEAGKPGKTAMACTEPPEPRAGRSLPINEGSRDQRVPTRGVRVDLTTQTGTIHRTVQTDDRHNRVIKVHLDELWMTFKEQTTATTTKNITKQKASINICNRWFGEQKTKKCVRRCQFKFGPPFLNTCARIYYFFICNMKNNY